MQTFTLTTTPARAIHVPTSWHDVTVGQLMKLWARPELPRLHILVGLSIEEINRIDPQDLLYFSNCLEFLGDREELNTLLRHIQS